MSEVCLCERDQDGRCPKCRGDITEKVDGLIKLFTKYREDIENLLHPTTTKDICAACTKRDGDLTFSRIVTSLIGELNDEEMARALVSYLAQAAQGLGVNEIPMMQKSWRDICLNNGWDPT